MKCKCGCGAEIREGTQFVRGHHWRVRRAAAGIPDSKECEQCGNTYYLANASRQRLSHWLERRFCSDECRALWNVVRMREGGESSPNWKGDAAGVQAGRKRARAMYPDRQPCEVCGDERTDRHHRDGDTLNNDLSNIAWLCRKHHIRTEDRMAYRRKPMTPERLARKRANAAARQRRYKQRKRAARELEGGDEPS